MLQAFAQRSPCRRRRRRRAARAKDMLPRPNPARHEAAHDGGSALLRQLKQDPRTQLIPLLVLSGLSQKNENRLRLAGAAAYFEKSMLNLSGEGSALLNALQSLMTEPAPGESQKPWFSACWSGCARGGSRRTACSSDRVSEVGSKADPGFAARTRRRDPHREAVLTRATESVVIVL
jgi:CheY-like chemotaxis protein